MGSRRGDHFSADGASAGKIFIGGLAKDTTLETFLKHFEKYGEITDHVIMKDRHTGRPRGFGFITYADPSIVDSVIEDNHIINGKQVEIKRTFPKGTVGAQTNSDFKTKKIFVGGIPASLTEDELKNYFEKYGEVVEHEIIRDHVSKRSRGFGFVVFDSEKVVNDILADGNMIELAGTQVEIKKAEPKKPSNPSYGSYHSDPRARSYDEGFSRYNDYNGFGNGVYGSSSYRAFGALSDRYSDYRGYGGHAADFGGSYGSYGDEGLGSFREPTFGYYNRFSTFDGGLGGSSVAGYERGGGYGGVYGGYESGLGPSFGGGPGGFYGGRASYGSSRYHPYSR